MPAIRPRGGEVDWPLEEGVLGVVGVAPWATVAFCQAFYSLVDAHKDWHFPRVLLDINTKIPSRGRHLQLGETDPSPAIAATIGELAASGATVAVVICNTAHILFDRWGKAAPIPVLNIIDETTKAVADLRASFVAPLVSAALAEHDLYGTAAEQSGIRCHRLKAAHQRTVNALIAEVKVRGMLTPESTRSAMELVATLKTDGIDTIVLGCTELSLMGELCARMDLGVVDSNAALARGALRHLRLPAHLTETR
jgi:aspartate racemase